MPLAFDDAAIARLAGAVRKVSPRKRKRWLADVARQLDTATPSRNSRNAQWCRASRARAKSGAVIYRLELDEVAIQEMLVNEGLLPARQEYTRRQVEAALTKFLVALTDITVGSNSGTGA
jgi:hypothetical protein